MRKLLKVFSSFLAAALCLALMTVSASAAVTGVRDLGDGSVEIQWDDTDVSQLVVIFKMSESSDADVAAYGYTHYDVAGKMKQVNYYLAPGQSYWLLTIRQDGSWSAPYAYNVGPATNFNEWRTAPTLSKFGMKKKNMNGKYDSLNFFAQEEVSSRDALSKNGFGVTFTFNYPQLKNIRTFLWQVVVTDPYGCPTVVEASSFDLPVGRSWIAMDYYPLEDYFRMLLDTRGEVPVGEYFFSIYWDGQRVSTESFRVR